MIQIGDNSYDPGIVCAILICLTIFLVIVIGLWVWGQYSPKIKHFRVSALISFILLLVLAATFFAVTMKNSVETVFGDYFQILFLIILGPGGFLTFCIWKSSAGEFELGEYSIPYFLLTSSFVINSFIIFGIIKFVAFIRKNLTRILSKKTIEEMT